MEKEVNSLYGVLNDACDAVSCLKQFVVTLEKDDVFNKALLKACTIDFLGIGTQLRDFYEDFFADFEEE